ncbi:hypothetical protein B0T11DRAFT_298876 [Plectosphaerella cucumerina]|uniref:Uncharacterized protein n=1 Tax=Plectosphaerella cucumerina TaxID=40658 RepID=A0A8K0X4D3_9PEZI|nr:hypothetical protein B0T11DRAFT_298876 [Plectosphaerella cucumerina]
MACTQSHMIRRGAFLELGSHEGSAADDSSDSGWTTVSRESLSDDLSAGADKYLDDTTATGWADANDSASPSVSGAHDTPMDSLFNTNDGTTSPDEGSLPDTEPSETSFPTSSQDPLSSVTFKEDARRDISTWALGCLPAGPIDGDTWSPLSLSMTLSSTLSGTRDSGSYSPLFVESNYQASTVPPFTMVDKLCIRNPQPYLEEQAAENFRRLRINGEIILSKVPLAKVATLAATLAKVGFSQAASVDIKATFRRYLRQFAMSMDEGNGLETPSELIWLLNEYPPPRNCPETLTYVAFGGLLLELAGGESLDLPCEGVTSDDIDTWRAWCQKISEPHDLCRLVIEPSHTWHTLCVSKQDFSNGLWATILLSEGAKALEASLLPNHRLILVCETVLAWLRELLADAGEKECWREFDTGIGAVVFRSMVDGQGPGKRSK